LTDYQKRNEYDFLRYNQEAYFQKYGASVLWAYAPQSDASIIIILLLLVANWFTWLAQKQRWQNVADRLIKAAVEDWSASMGGTTESKQLRDQALDIIEKAEQEKAEKEKEAAPESNNGSSKPLSSNSKKAGGKKKEKVSVKEKKSLQEEQLKPIISGLVDKMHDFGAGFHKPTWKDLFLVKVVKFPYYVGTGMWWQTMYLVRRLQKKELNDDEREVLTERAVGHVTWDLASEENRKAMVERELWVMDNLVVWKEEQEVKSWSKADQKYYAKMKKKGITPSKES
jgi:DnaJ family protein C protein 25